MVVKFGYRAVMTTGLVLVALSLVGLLFVQLDTPLWIILVVFFIFGFGMGNVIAPASTVMQNVLPLARAGAGSAVQNTVRQVGGALGVAIIGTVLATQYASRITPALGELPDQVPDEARQAAENSIVATDGLLSGLEQSGAPATVIDALRASAFDSFLASAHVTYIISVTVVVIAALLVAFALPVITPPRKDVPVPEDSPTDDLVRLEEEEYPEQLAEEVVDDGRPG